MLKRLISRTWLQLGTALFGVVVVGCVAAAIAGGWTGFWLFVAALTLVLFAIAVLEAIRMYREQQSEQADRSNLMERIVAGLARQDAIDSTHGYHVTVERWNELGVAAAAGPNLRARLEAARPTQVESVYGFGLPHQNELVLESLDWLRAAANSLQQSLPANIAFERWFGRELIWLPDEIEEDHDALDEMIRIVVWIEDLWRDYAAHVATTA